ncbi:hypothetical protein J4438_01440 [Candidatus Woesearchaeota archaeon]|nr:hypothetical protein [Candidatus Woesearchaeota archaeon]
MIPLENSPNWFSVPSIIIDFFSFLVLFSISLISLKYYNLSGGNKKYKYISFAFLLICASFFFKLITNLALYYNEFIRADSPTIITDTLETIRSYNIFTDLTFTLFVFLNLIGLYFLYSVYQEKQAKSMMFLITYFIIISTYFSNLNYYVFHITSFLLLTIISILYFDKYALKGNESTKVLGYSFSSIAISQILFMFVSVDKSFFILAEIIQLLGYLLLFLILRNIIIHGKKKKQN